MNKDAKFYLRQLELADKEEKKWRERAEKVIDTYRGERQKGPSRFNILWSNTQTQLPAMYSARPKPDVRRRWRSENKVGRDIAQAVERALEFSMDSYDFDRMGNKLTLDYLLPGRMVARVRYHPFFKETDMLEPVQEGDEGAEELEDGSFIARRRFRELISEEVRAYHVPWDKYRMSPAKCWDDVWWVAYGDNFLSKKEIIEQFGEEHSEVPLSYTDEDDKDADDIIQKAQVWELWDKDEKVVVAVVKGYDKLLMKEEDPLRLVNFFPQPEPAMLIETTDSMIPIPEYTMYQFQAEELNVISQRIASLAKSMRAVGFYPGEDAAKMNEMMNSTENILIPVENWASYAEKGGLKGMIDWLPIADIASVWQKLIIQRDQIIQSIFQLVGISDIQRGSSDPRETKGAQQLKANFGNRRILPKQQRLQRFLRDILRIKGEIIAEHFDSKTLAAMTGTEVTEEMRAVMRSDALRTFNIDIETDSTVAPDAEADKQGVAEFMGAMSQFLAQAQPIIAVQPAAVKPLGKMLLWMSRKFKIAREVEDEIEEFITSFDQMPAQQDQKEQQLAAAEKQKAQIQEQEMQAALQVKAQELQAEQQLKAQELQADIKQRQDQAIADARLKQAESEADIRRKDQIAQADMNRKEAESQAKMSREGRETSIREQASEPKEKEEPKTKTIRLITEDGKVVGGEITEGDDTRTVRIENA